MTKKKTTTKKPVKKAPIPTFVEWLEEVSPGPAPKKKQSEQSENQSQQSG